MGTLGPKISSKILIFEAIDDVVIFKVPGVRYKNSFKFSSFMKKLPKGDPSNCFAAQLAAASETANYDSI